MTESGINSFPELVLLYSGIGFLLTLVWAYLLADAVLGDGPSTRVGAVWLRRSRLFALLGVAHVGFALIAWDLGRLVRDDALLAEEADAAQRAIRFSFATLAIGCLVAVAISIPLLD